MNNILEYISFFKCRVQKRIMIEYYPASWTGITCGTIDPPRLLDGIKIEGIVAELLNDGDKSLYSFSLRPLDNDLPHNQDSRIMVRLRENQGYSCNAKDYPIDKRLIVSGSFVDHRQKGSKFIGTINASMIEFLKR